MQQQYAPIISREEESETSSDWKTYGKYSVLVGLAIGGALLVASVFHPQPTVQPLDPEEKAIARQIASIMHRIEMQPAAGGDMMMAPSPGQAGHPDNPPPHHGGSMMMAPAPGGESITGPPWTQGDTMMLSASGNVAPGGKCTYHWVGTDCQSGSMCMDLGATKFCTYLNSLPEGMQCANTGNLYKTFCGSGMTCCDGKCVDKIACAAGKAGSVKTIAATAASIAAAAAPFIG